jgi:N-hydroxyarylamine O-acetyltransferase
MAVGAGPGELAAPASPDAAIPWDTRLPALRGDLLARYLTFIAVDRPVSPSLDALRVLQRAHLLAIPFETISPMLDESILLDEDAIAGKLLSGRRGGYCFEHNLLFGRALRALGFDAEILAGRALLDARADEPRPRTHIGVRVRFDGEEWLADVGYGRSAFRAPLDLQRRDVQEAGGHSFRIDLEGDEYVVRAQASDGAFIAQYVLAPQPVQQIDCEQLNLWVATDPRSIVRGALIVLRPLPQGRRALGGGRLVIDEPGRQINRELRLDEIAVVLREEFGLELPAPLPALVRPTGSWATHRA